jgi:hypothetical protein
MVGASEFYPSFRSVEASTHDGTEVIGDRAASIQARRYSECRTL